MPGLRAGDVADYLPAGDGGRHGLEAGGVGELGGVHTEGGAAFVVGVEDAVDLPLLRRVEGGPVADVRWDFVDLQLENGP